MCVVTLLFVVWLGGSIAHWRGGGAESERRANKACWIGERQRGERLDRHSGCEDGASVVSEHIARVAVDLYVGHGRRGPTGASSVRWGITRAPGQ